MNKKISYIILIIVIFIFIYGFSNSYTSRSIDHISYVIALAIDSADDNNLKVTFEFMDTSAFSADGSSEGSCSLFNTVTASSIDSAINMMNVYSAKEINLSHCKLVTFSEDVASNGIFSEVSELINNTQVRPTTNIVIAKDSAKYLENFSYSLDTVLTKYFNVLPESAEYTGYTSNITLGKFYDTLINSNSGSTAILGGVSGDSTSTTSVSDMIAGESTIKGKNKSENIGLAVFDDDKYIGNLTAIETLCHSVINNEANSFFVTVQYPNSDYYIDVSLSEDTPTKIDVSIDNDTANININLSFTGRALSVIKDLNYSDENTLNELSNSVSNYMKENILKYLDKTQNTFGCDIDYFYRYGRKNFMSIAQWNDFNWKEKYKNATFQVNVTANVLSSLLVSEG